MLDAARKIQLGTSLLLHGSSCKLKHPASSGFFWFGFPSVLRHLAGTSGNLSVPIVCKQAVLGQAGGQEVIHRAQILAEF